MDYNDNPATKDPMEGVDAGGSDMPDQGVDKQEVMLSADHFPEGMSPKKGEKLTFCCTDDPDGEGNVTGYFEKGDSGGKAPQDDWESDFKKAMSPRNSDEDAQ